MEKTTFNPTYTADQIPELAETLIQGAQIVIPETGIQDKLELAHKEDRPLRIKMGFDPTSPDLHLGHAVAMHQLRKFQQIGHIPVVIIGDFTGRIGDPSGKNKSRPLVNAEQLTKNAETYVEQLGKILDLDTIEVHKNSEWLDKMSLEDTINLLAQGTLSQIISRDDFRKRLDSESPIALHEIVYPYLQGSDSVAVNADIEIGGVDQLYAFQAGRTLQENRGDKPQALLLMPLLRGLSGEKKMSKSLNNYVGLTDAPKDMFGKIMSIPDTHIEEYLRLASTYDAHQVGDMISSIDTESVNPMEIKLRLARNITALYHGDDGAKEAADFFQQQFRDKDSDKEYVDVSLERTDNTDVVSLILATEIVDSKSKARRLIEQGGVKINGQKVTIDAVGVAVTDPEIELKIGKRGFFKILFDATANS